MYIEQFANGRFFMMNFYQLRFRQSDRWALLANNNDLEFKLTERLRETGEVVRCLYSRSDSHGFVQTILCRYFIPIYRVVRCSILYLYQHTKRNVKLLQFNNGSTLYQVRFWIWFFQAHDHHNTIV